MKSTEKNTKAINFNTIVMILSIMLAIRGQITLPVNQNIEIKNLIVNINTIEREIK